jgi:hypothetical protein
MRGNVSLLVGILMLAITMVGSHSTAQGAPATIEMKIVKVAGIIGLQGGRGTLYFNGQAYPLRVGGLSLGVGFALAAYDMKGTVHNLVRVEDLYGTYSEASAGVAFIGGGKVAVMTNARGVRLEVSALTLGVELQLNLAGINIRPGR